MLSTISILFISIFGYLSYYFVNYTDDFNAKLMKVGWEVLRTKIYLEYKLQQAQKLIGYNINSENTTQGEINSGEEDFENAFWFIQKNKEGIFELEDYEEVENEEGLSEIKKITIETFDNGILFFRFKHPHSNEVKFQRIVKTTTMEHLHNVDECKNPFIQVELTENGTTTDILKDLTPFFLKNNVILDQIFLEWFIYYYYERSLDEDYTLNIIDSEVNTISLTKDNNVFNKIIL